MPYNKTFVGSEKPTEETPPEDEPKIEAKPERKARSMRLVITCGPNGGKARRWMVGPPVTTEAYDFAPGVPVLVNANDAETLLAGVGGRVFVESRSLPKG